VPSSRKESLFLLNLHIEVLTDDSGVRYQTKSARPTDVGRFLLRRSSGGDQLMRSIFCLQVVGTAAAALMLLLLRRDACYTVGNYGDRR